MFQNTTYITLYFEYLLIAFALEYSVLLFSRYFVCCNLFGIFVSKKLLFRYFHFLTKFL